MDFRITDIKLWRRRVFFGASLLVVFERLKEILTPIWNTQEYLQYLCLVRVSPLQEFSYTFLI